MDYLSYNFIVQYAFVPTSVLYRAVENSWRTIIFFRLVGMKSHNSRRLTFIACMAAATPPAAMSPPTAKPTLSRHPPNASSSSGFS